jgi:hypothetical protein
LAPVLWLRLSSNSCIDVTREAEASKGVSA